MAIKVSNIYAIVDNFREDVKCLVNEEGIPAELLWILMRQVSDYELLILSLAEKGKQ